MATKKPAAWEDAIALIDRVKFVYLSSLDEGGGPETRVLFNLRKTRAKALAKLPGAAGFGTYLGTNASSRKVGLLRKDARACLYYSDNAKFEGCSVRGRFVEEGDGAIKKAVWTKAWDIYYPGGLEGGDFCLLRFVPEKVRYYHGMSVAGFDA